MNSKTIFIAGAALLACAAVTVTNADAADKTRPNIIFLLSDDQRFDTLGSMGNPIIQTPHLDQLAAEGVLFRNSFATTSICATSRASFLTGQYARRHGVHDFRTILSPEAFAKTYPMLLRESGYRTAFIGKWGVGGKLPAENFDYWDGFAGQGRYFYPDDPVHITQKLEESAVKFLMTAKADEPFCLAMSFKAAHCQDGDPHPFQPDHRYDALYNDVTIPTVPKTETAVFENLPEWLQTSEGRVRWQIRFATPEMYQKSVKDYYRLITGLDRVVGSIVAQLREQNLLDNTVIIYTADHGFFLGEYGLAGKWLMYEESIRTPLLIYDPRLPQAARGKIRDEMVLNIDIAPTIIELADVKRPETMQGDSLVPLLKGESPEWREEWFYEHLFPHKRIPKSEGVRTARWKYIRYVESDPLREELYDLQADPQELDNLAGNARHQSALTDMRQRWERLREDLR